MKILSQSVFVLVLGFICASLVFADEAPVVAATPSGDTSGLSLDKRVAILERQMAAANQINLMNQVNNLQHQMQELQGQVDELSHMLTILQTQSASQYADVDQRLRKLEGKGGPRAATTASSVASTPSLSQTSGTSGNIQVTNQTSGADQAYQEAYDKVKSGNYSEGIVAMKKFLTQYPNSTYASNAHYWAGQMYLLNGDGKGAADEFNIVIAQYPQNQKTKDAALKLGFADLLENKTTEAKAQFKKVMHLYPGTSTAQLAEAHLAQIP
jgi:tol-pal system protein YbgF